MNENKKNSNPKLIYSKIILDLIENYKHIGEYYYNKNEIDDLEKENMNIIKDNINIYSELGLNFDTKVLKSKNIDEIYAEIIKTLIKKEKLENYEYTYNIIKQMDLESIDITEKIYGEIYNLLDENKNYVKEYLVIKEEDLFNYKKINFYYILLKYILKNSIFIYQINFLFKTRINIIKLIKLNSNIFSSFNIKIIDNNIKERLNYILEKIIDSKYYIQKYINMNNIDLNINKKNELDDKINELEVKNKSENDIIMAVEASSYNESNESNNSNSDSQINESNNKEDVIIKAIVSDIKEENINSLNKNSSSIISQKDPFKNSDLKESKSSKEIRGILIESETSNLNNINNIINVNNANKKIINNNSNSIIKFPFHILKLERIIGNHRIKVNKKGKIKNDINSKDIYTAEFIKQISQGLVSGGTNNVLNIYDKTYLKKIEILNLENISFNVSEIMIESILLLIVCSQNIFYLYKINMENKNYSLIKKIENFENSNFLYWFEQKTNNYFVFNENKSYFFSFLFSKLNYSYKKIIDIKSIKSGIKINKAFASFKTKNNLKFYNCNSFQVIKKEIKGFSFNYSPNGLTIINIERKELKTKILLCACKRYNKKQKNGILIVNLESDEIKIEIRTHYFYDTQEFEVYCFCPILILEEKEILKNECKMKETRYFLVGGFEKNKNQGLIKLYKLKFDENYFDYKIEYIQDIVIEKDKNKNFNNFKRPISSIIQSNIDGNILITCWDGNVYLLSLPDIEYYLKYDEKVENNVSFKKFFE